MESRGFSRHSLRLLTLPPRIQRRSLATDMRSIPGYRGQSELRLATSRSAELVTWVRPRALAQLTRVGLNPDSWAINAVKNAGLKPSWDAMRSINVRSDREGLNVP